MSGRERPGRGSEWRIDDVTFVFDYGQGSTADRFLIRKPPGLFELYRDLAPRFHGAVIVELGIAAGGSTALLSLLARPRKLIACEIEEQPVAALAEFIERRHLGSVVRPAYGVDQADRVALAELLDRELGGQALDLVIDDASHRYDETRASFDVLFPRLRPGGLFIIEDWAADYAYARRIAATLEDPSSSQSGALRERLADSAGGVVAPRPLPQLGVELLHACGGTDGIVAELEINRHWISVERGAAPLDPSGFRLDDHVVDTWAGSRVPEPPFGNG